MADGWITLVSALGLGAVLGAVANSLLAERRDRTTREVAFRTRQLEELYGPLLSLRKEIRAHSELREKLQRAIDDQHARTMLLPGPGKVASASDRFIDPVVKNVKDENETFRQLLMPRYHDMVKIFQEKMWLAEPETRDYFPKLVEFVFVWDRMLDGRLPHEVAPAIGHTEQNLNPFYTHLERITDASRMQIGARMMIPPQGGSHVRDRFFQKLRRRAVG
jgi:hypothetical protein